MEWDNSFLAPIVTAIGFIINYGYTKKIVVQESKKKKINMSIENLKDIPKELLDLLMSYREMASTNNSTQIAKQNQNKINDLNKNREILFNKIFTYGSKDAIKICSQLLADRNESNCDKGTTMEQARRVFCYQILLFCEIKYELTGIKTNPEAWLKCNLLDFKNNREEYKRINNEIAVELHLKRFLRIK